ncbi:IS66 family transposase [Cardinium endosymbiont of Philonthus spinipes]|uniref:IS66 family transposase n=1 Tax=Cardinium endosymbiont of Philonthus spinipes TaxID=3077941 RepID=UPI00313C6B57
MDSLSSIVISLQSEISLLKSSISVLEADNAALRGEIAVLTANNSSLKEVITSLSAANKSLSEENCKLKDKLGLTSKTSSIPSSKELYKIKRNKVKSTRNRGGQPGHPGTTRTKLLADEVIELSISDSCSCGGHVSMAAKPYIHQKIDIPEIKPHVINYHVHHGRCRQCGKRHTASLPQGVTSDTFGPRIKSVISSLTGFYKNSKQEVRHILKDIFNLDISLGSISNSEGRVASKCQSAYQSIEAAIRASQVLHIDETGHFNSGKLGWCWIFTNPMVTLLKLTKSRSKKILESSGLKPKKQIIVSDRYAAYNYFPPTHRQLCWSHLARDFERFAHSCHSGVKVLGFYLKKMASELFSLHRAFAKDTIELFTFLRRIRKLRKRIWYGLKAIASTPGAVHANRVARNIMRAEPMLWKFCKDPLNIPLTNNLAERQIRHYVLYRKNCYFTQSERGNRFVERIISLYLTWRQQNLNPFKQLQNIIA